MSEVLADIRAKLAGDPATRARLFVDKIEATLDGKEGIKQHV